MKPTHIEHIGIAVKSLDESIPFFEKILGLECEHIEEISDQKVKTASFKIGNTKIELLEPTSDNSPVSKFIDKNGGGLHHIAFAVDDVSKALKDAKDAGCKLIDEKPRTGADNLQIGFLHPKSTFKVLMEFCGKK